MLDSQRRLSITLPKLVVALLCVVFLVLGCGEQSDSMPSSEQIVFSQANHFELHIMPVPDPLTRGENSLNLYLTYGDVIANQSACCGSSTPRGIPEATILCELRSTSDTQASSISLNVFDEGNGRYSIPNLLFEEAGQWEAHFTITHDNISDGVIATLEVN